jgi:serine/threonine-protein kinase
MVAQVEPLDLKPGELVDGWRILRRLGSGGYAVVYEVEKDGKHCALKLATQPEGSGDKRRVDSRARREVACLEQLDHPHIIHLLTRGRWPKLRSGFLYMVLDLVDGYTLAQWVERTHPTAHEVVVLFLKLFEALEYIHARGVFHRDLSLRNILVTRQGEPVIIDFGAADYATAEELTDGPLPPGTPRNRSPEAQRFWNENRLNPEARYTFKATDDIFALGADLYDVLTDPTPTRSERRPPLGNEVMEPPTPHRATQGRVPAELSAYAMTLIQHQPERRPATAKDARRPLEEFARLEGEGWHRPIHPVAAQLPPEPPEAAPVPVPTGPPGGVQVPPPSQPLPAQVSPAPTAARGPAQHGPRRAWQRSAFFGLLALSVLVAVVAAILLHSPAPPPTSSVLAEKPTSRPTPLASPLPTQQEASPSVTPPYNSLTFPSATPNPQQVQKVSGRRVRSKAEKCALLVASLAWLEAGCSGVQTRPEPEACPAEAIKAMEQELGWDLDGIGSGPGVVLDVTRGSIEEIRRTQPGPTVWKDGPVTGAVALPKGKAPEGTRLDGHLWTTGERIYGRYVRAHLPGGRTVPICVELVEGGGELGIEKEKGSKPGAPMADRVAATWAVSRWR